MPRLDVRFWTGTVLSVAVLAAASGVLWWMRDDLSDVKLGDWGSFLGGVAATIAIVWLVLGHRQQSEDLRHQRAELALHRQELALSREEMILQRGELARQAAATEGALKLAGEAHAMAEADRAARRLRLEHPTADNFGGHHCNVVLIVAGSEAAKIAVERPHPAGLNFTPAEFYRKPPGERITVGVFHQQDGRNHPLPGRFVVAFQLVDVNGQEGREEIEVTIDGTTLTARCLR